MTVDYEPKVYEPTRLAQAALTTTHAVVYLVPTGKKAVVQRLVLANTALVPAEVSVSLVDSSSPGSLANRIMHQVPLAAEGLVAFDMYQVVDAAGAIAASASPATVTLTASGSLLDFVLVGNWDGVDPALQWDKVHPAQTWDDVAAGFTPVPADSWDAYPLGLPWDQVPGPWDSAQATVIPADAWDAFSPGVTWDSLTRTWDGV